MKCFPFMQDIAGKSCLLAGGGRVALRKAEKLLPFGVRLFVCTREVCTELAPHLRADEYSPALLDGMDFAVAATDDRALNARIAADCRARHIPVNSVDDKENCDFYFPALIVRGNVTIGISTGGESPALAAALREYIGRLLPEDLENIAAQAAQRRGGGDYAAFVREALCGREEKK